MMGCYLLDRAGSRLTTMNRKLKADINVPGAKSPDTMSKENGATPSTPLRYEQLVRWAIREWRERYPGQPYEVLWASDDCASVLARQRIQPGRRLKGKARYMGYEMLDCPYVVPITRFYYPGRNVIMTDSVGAFSFKFQRGDETFEALYASAYYEEKDGRSIDAIVLVPTQHLAVWAAFQTLCSRTANRLERSPSVYIIGGSDETFKPNVEWNQVILPEALKADLRADVETFFTEGVDLYRQLNLPPFRKILLVGPPGTGKSTLCAALAKLALNKKCVVVYISSADIEGATFDKIHRALRIVANSRHPVLVIVEELDVYLNKEEKSQILNVLDGLETPNNPRGALLIATTNYPEVIDERIAKRPGRVDRIVYIPPIQDEDQARRMLMRYMDAQYRDEHDKVLTSLIGHTGAFVREVALYARMLAVHNRQNQVTLEVLQQSVANLSNQISTGLDLLPRRPLGFSLPEVPGSPFSANQH